MIQCVLNSAEPLEKLFFYSNVYSCLLCVNSYFKSVLAFTFKFTNKYNVNYKVNRSKQVNSCHKLFTQVIGGCH